MLVNSTASSSFHNKRVTVAGLGRFGGGINVARWLVAQGANIVVTDRDVAEKLTDSVAQLDGLPIEFVLGAHRESDFTDADLVVASPALPPTNPYLQAATRAGVPITTEIRLLIERLPREMRTVGVTGTKGKSTTTTLLRLMLETKHKVWTGGNIGGSLLFDLPKMQAGDVVLLELSSYMLEHLRSLNWSPRIAVVTMLSSDHLEWHGSAAAYLDAKKNLLRFQSAGDVAIISHSPLADEFAATTQARVVRVPSNLHKPFRLAIPGEHNQLNAQTAFAAASQLGIDREIAQQAVEDFAGLPHRLQRVHVSSEGAAFFNDSIATIPEAAVAALHAFPPRSVIQIVGGYDKGLDLSALAEALACRAKAVLTIGATGPMIGAAVRMRNDQIEVTDCGELTAAVSRAKRITTSESIVLLSTGCASYDQFENFEKRGELFAHLAKSANI